MMNILNIHKSSDFRSDCLESGILLEAKNPKKIENNTWESFNQINNSLKWLVHSQVMEQEVVCLWEPINDIDFAKQQKKWQFPKIVSRLLDA